METMGTKGTSTSLNVSGPGVTILGARKYSQDAAAIEGEILWGNNKSPKDRFSVYTLISWGRIRERKTATLVYLSACHFSKFVLLRPMKKATAEGVIKYLEQYVFHVFGVPEMIHSDNGKYFVSAPFQKFLRKYDFQFIKTAFYALSV